MLNYNMDSIEVIRRNVSDSLKECGIQASVSIENNGRAIGARNKFDEEFNGQLYVWIRLFPRDNGKYIVDISSIEIPESKRNCGTFQIIYNRLKRCKYTDCVRIIGVCSKEMYNWCIKNKLTQFNVNSFK